MPFPTAFGSNYRQTRALTVAKCLCTKTIRGAAEHMARRRKSGGEALLDLVALLPWWMGLALAVLSYFLLHKLATQPIVANASAGAAALLGPGLILKPLAMVGQYIAPLICVLGAGISAARRHKRANLLERTVANPGADVLQGMSWQEFELMVGEGFRRRGYGVRELGGGGPDGGVDLVLTKLREKFFVQCKQWKAFKVGVTTVRELYGVMAAGGAAGGFVVTSGQFTQEATAFASGRNIELIDGPELLRLLRDARASAADASGQTASDQRTRRKPPVRGASVSPLSPDASGAPGCPKCGKPMVRRVARRGAAPGKVFWGCTAYSDGCHGMREIMDV
jgi:restriction system protein